MPWHFGWKGYATGDIACLCEQALRGLDAVLRRAGRPHDELLLPQANALLSERVAAEFPLVGVRKKRIETARDACRRLLKES